MKAEIVAKVADLKGSEPFTLATIGVGNGDFVRAGGRDFVLAEDGQSIATGDSYVGPMGALAPTTEVKVTLDDDYDLDEAMAKLNAAEWPLFQAFAQLGCRYVVKLVRTDPTVLSDCYHPTNKRRFIYEEFGVVGYRLTPDEEMEKRKALWMAIHRYVEACGGDPSTRVLCNTPRQDAVIEIESIVFGEQA